MKGARNDANLYGFCRRRPFPIGVTIDIINRGIEVQLDPNRQQLSERNGGRAKRGDGRAEHSLDEHGFLPLRR